MYEPNQLIGYNDWRRGCYSWIEDEVVTARPNWCRCEEVGEDLIASDIAKNPRHQSGYEIMYPNIYHFYSNPELFLDLVPSSFQDNSRLTISKAISKNFSPN